VHHAGVLSDGAIEEIHGKFGRRLVVLINNAANYTDMQILREQVIPLMRENGRIINVASECGIVRLGEASRDLQGKYVSDINHRTTRYRLLEEFISAIEFGTLEVSSDNPRSPYLISGAIKTTVIALTRIEAR
jgi:NAD(P)-dependent dehydrogenase (short-subunit alcohol dehydrogenase family)